MKYLCLALASLFFAKMPILAMGTLSEIVCGIETPQPGGYYECGVYPMRVFQVVSANGVIAHVDPRDFSSSEIRTMVYLRTNASNMYEGMFIKGMYQCTGYFDYQTVLGATKRLPAFRELTNEEREKIAAEIREAIMREKEEALRLEREAQPKRRELVQKFFSSLSFDPMRNIYIDRRLAGEVRNISVEVQHFALPQLQTKCRQGDWLGVLNVAYDIVNENSDFTNHYKAFPDEKEIKALEGKIKNFGFRAKWTLPQDSAILACASTTEGLVSALKMRALWRGNVFLGGSIPLFSQSRIYIGMAGKKPYMPSDESLRNAKDSEYLIPGIVGIETRRRMCEAQFERRQISETEFNKKVRLIDQELYTAVSEIFIKMSDSAQIYKAAKKNEDEVKGEFLRQRKAIFEQLARLKLRLQDHVVVQKSLLDYIHSVKVKENIWQDLCQAHQKGDYMTMLKLVWTGPGEFNPNDIDCIHKSAKILAKKSIHLELKLTHSILIKECVWENSGFSVISQELKCSNSTRRGTMTVCFNLSDDGLIYICEDINPDPLYEYYRKACDQVRAVRSDVNYGNIGEDEAKSKEQTIVTKCKAQIIEYLDTAKLKTKVESINKIAHNEPPDISLLDMHSHEEVYSVGKEKKDKTQAQRSVNRGNGSNQKWKNQTIWKMCPDCNGARNVSKGQCTACGGTGKTRTPIKRGIGGRMMGGRETQCTKCKGKGEIKESCKECKGRGKVKEAL